MQRSGILHFFDQLDTLIPSTLDIYLHSTFRNNHFDEYVETIFRLWIIMYRFQRKNYNKIRQLLFIPHIGYLYLEFESEDILCIYLQMVNTMFDLNILR